MAQFRSIVAFPVALALTACVAAPPQGPRVAVLPGDGKSFPQFQQDDATCRQYANQQTGGISAAQAANDSQVGSSVLGTLLGAAAGAAIGAAAHNPGAGAAIGAGTGLAVGTAVGANNAQASAAAVQQRYDSSYLQCMASNGDKVPVAAAPNGYYPYYGGPAYYPAYPGYYYGPTVAFGVGVGGWHHW